jgi:hypothetical protein
VIGLDHPNVAQGGQLRSMVAPLGRHDHGDHCGALVGQLIDETVCQRVITADYKLGSMHAMIVPAVA